MINKKPADSISKNINFCLITGGQVLILIEIQDGIVIKVIQ